MALIWATIFQTARETDTASIWFQWLAILNFELHELL
mgnify:CR=1 FL=1